MQFYRAPTSGGLIQTVSAKLAVDISTTSTSFVDMLTLNMSTQTANSTLKITSCGAYMNTNNGKVTAIRLVLDGASLGGHQVYCTNAASANPFSFSAVVTGVTIGAHTVKIQWQTAANTIQCRPASIGGDLESAVLIVQESTV